MSVSRVFSYQIYGFASDQGLDGYAMDLLPVKALRRTKLDRRVSILLTHSPTQSINLSASLLTRRSWLWKTQQQRVSIAYHSYQTTRNVESVVHSKALYISLIPRLVFQSLQSHLQSSTLVWRFSYHKQHHDETT
jgi:hypothetical protein